MKNPTNTERNVFGLINFYSPKIYWLMCLDSCRINAYENAIRQYEHEPEKAVWLDIGTGAHMPLARLLIKYGVAKHVHAVEANCQTYQFAKHLREQVSEEEKRKISLHGCYSSDIYWCEQDPRPNAIIHEIVGSISSDEGCIKVMHDTIERLHGNISFCIPYQIGTLCIPVSQPRISLISSLCSFLLGKSMRIIKHIGIQGMVNPPKNAFLCDTPQLIEDFILKDYTAKPLEKCRIYTTKFIVTSSAARWSGFYLAPYILTSKDNKNGSVEIDALRCLTSWPVRYVQMYDHENGIHVRQGDEICVKFESDLTNECPTYRLEAWVNNSYLVRSSFAWRGPAIN
ncbi:unnamed protein product [Adineta ricciae]|nr:unnamed protein product [Adineta ricciae]